MRDETNDLIDLGDFTVETKGNTIQPGLDVDNSRFQLAGLAED